MDKTLKPQNLNSDVIETDEDTPEEYIAENGSQYSDDLKQKDFDIRELPYTVFELKRKCDQERIILDPDFQRNPTIWTPEQRSKFIESIILNFPLPYWYVKQTQKGEYIVVDGLQRTLAIRDFIDNKFKLTGLKVLLDLNDCSFNDLKERSGDYETRIEDKKISLYVIQPSTPWRIIYEIFERVNTGGTQLEKQEIRNCLFSGKSTDILRELSDKDCFKQAIDSGFSSKRMKDRELILRYFAFKVCNDYHQDYQGDMNSFLEDAMKKINEMPEGQIDKLRNDFERVMRLTYDFFEKGNFRLPTDKNRGKVNMIMFESISYFFSTHDNQFLDQHKKTIKQNFAKLLKDSEYVDSIKRVKNDKNTVIKRFDLAQKILGDV